MATKAKQGTKNFLSLSKKFWMISGAIFVVALAVILSVIWWYEKVYTTPQNVFWGMIDNSLATPSVTKETTQDGGTTKVVEFAQMIFSPLPVVHDIRHITAPVNDSPLHLTLESIGTPTDDYQRYSYVQQVAGKPQSAYDNLYKQWLHNGGVSQNANPRIFNGAVFGAILFGDINQPQRGQIVKTLRSAYKIDYQSVGQQNTGGRKTYTFSVAISLQKYAQAAHDYAKYLGAPNYAQISPADYQVNDSSRVFLTVDVLSRQLVKSVYQSSNMVEAYSGYGITAQVKPPSRVATPAEFENAINQISP